MNRWLCLVLINGNQWQVAPGAQSTANSGKLRTEAKSTAISGKLRTEELAKLGGGGEWVRHVRDAEVEETADQIEGRQQKAGGVWLWNVLVGGIGLGLGLGLAQL